MTALFFYPIIILFSLFFFGYGLTTLTIPKKLKPYVMWLSPWFFIISTIFVLVVLSLAGISVAQASLFLIVFFSGLTIYALFKTKNLIPFFPKEDIIIALFVFGSILFNLSPLILKDHFLTTISFGNNDAIAYASTPEYLTHKTLGESFVRPIPSKREVVSLFYDDYRWGTPMISSFLIYLFHIKGYELAYLLNIILFALTLPLVYVLFKILYKPSPFGLFLSLALFSFNSNLLYMVYHVFFSQVLFWGIGLILLILFLSYLALGELKKEHVTNYDLFIGLTIGVFYFSYHEATIFLLSPLLLFLVLKIFSKDGPFLYVSALMRIALIAFLVSSISIFRNVFFNIVQLVYHSPFGIRWQPFRSRFPFANPFEMMGLYSIHNFEPMRNLFAIPLSIAVVVVIVFGFFKSRSRLLLASFIIVDVFFLYWTGIYNYNFFDYNRVVTYTLPLFLVLFTIGVFALISRFPTSIRLSVIFLLIIIVVFSGMKLNRRFMREYLIVDKSFIFLETLRKRDIKEPIYSGLFLDSSIPLWNHIWTGYFLYPIIENVMYPKKFEQNKFANKVPDNSLVLIPKKIIPPVPPPKLLLKNILWENDDYRFGRICNSDECFLNRSEDLSGVEIGKSEFEDSLLTSGWSEKEVDSRWSNAKESTLRLVTKYQGYERFIFEGTSLQKPQELTVYIDNQYIGTQSIDVGWKTYSISLPQLFPIGLHRVLFRYAHLYKPSEVMKTSDTRDLSVNFRKIRFQ